MARSPNWPATRAARPARDWHCLDLISYRWTRAVGPSPRRSPRCRALRHLQRLAIATNSMGSEHVAIVEGNPGQATGPCGVRSAPECLTRLPSARSARLPPQSSGPAHIEAAAEGVVVYLRQGRDRHRPDFTSSSLQPPGRGLTRWIRYDTVYRIPI